MELYQEYRLENKERHTPDEEDVQEKGSFPTAVEKEETNTKRPTASSDTSDDERIDSSSKAALDLAMTLSFKAGDRLEVQWEIEKKGKTEVHWWGATLLEYDGRTMEEVAIRHILYDAYPELGFETCQDDVVFLGDDLIVSPDSQTQLKFRREGEE